MSLKERVTAALAAAQIRRWERIVESLLEQINDDTISTCFRVEMESFTNAAHIMSLFQLEGFETTIKQRDDSRTRWVVKVQLVDSVPAKMAPTRPVFGPLACPPAGYKRPADHPIPRWNPIRPQPGSRCRSTPFNQGSNVRVRRAPFPIPRQQRLSDVRRPISFPLRRLPPLPVFDDWDTN